MIDDGAVDKMALVELSMKQSCRLLKGRYVVYEDAPGDAGIGYNRFEYLCEETIESDRF